MQLVETQPHYLHFWGEIKQCMAHSGLCIVSWQNSVFQHWKIMYFDRLSSYSSLKTFYSSFQTCILFYPGYCEKCLYGFFFSPYNGSQWLPNVFGYQHHSKCFLRRKKDLEQHKGE